ncbi:D-alanyl-D-alanine carboxypeptidase family protein [Alsobacter sp. R-9]
MARIARRMPQPATLARRIASRLSLLALVTVSPLLAAGAADAAAPYVVVEVSSGRVLMQEDATMPWHPASVTKLMTAYVALKAMREGRIGWETPIAASMRAARAAPSKIGLKPGQEVTLENALKMLLVKSANDMAIVVAEGVGGTVEQFADMMNAEARNLGMRESHFINPNGLHAEGQQTSARDMAILARALLLQFPDHADLFSIPAVQLGDRVMNNTNGLIGRYPGIEGMKTGFVCASGFNLVALASRNGQRLIAVVMGQPSAADRTIKAAALLDKGFGTTGGFFSLGSGTLDSLPRSPVAKAPNVREDICVRRKGPPASEDELDRAQAPAPINGDNQGFNLFGSQTVALAPGSSVRGSGGPRSLSQRAPLEPIQVFLGRSPGSATAPVAANAKPIPARPDEPTTATAYAGDKPRTIDPATPPVAAAAAGPMVLAPAKLVPLAAGASIGSGARAATTPKLGAIQPKPATPPTAAKAAATPATPSKTAAKPKPGAKPAAKATPKPAPKAEAKSAPKPAPAAKPKKPASDG